MLTAGSRHLVSLCHWS